MLMYARIICSIVAAFESKKAQNYDACTEEMMTPVVMYYPTIVTEGFVQLIYIMLRSFVSC